MVAKKKKGIRRKAKKKIIKKRVKKKTSKKVSRKDFEAFKFGVQRLNELRKELDSLDTRGFAKETQEIKSKLKNVSEIPNIEKAIKQLKLKIKNKYKPKKRRKSPSKEIKKGLEDIQDDLESIKRTRAGKADLKDIQDDLESIKRARSESRKSLEGIQSELRKIKRKPKTLIDSGVDILVDTNFNNFLNDTKRALSNRVKEKERKIDEILKIDLEKREFNFKKKHDNLLKDFDQNQKKLINDYNNKLKAVAEQKIKSEEGTKNERAMLESEFNKKFESIEKQKAKLKKDFEQNQKKLINDHNNKLKAVSNEKIRLEKGTKQERTRLEQETEKERTNLEEDSKELKLKLEQEFNKKFESIEKQKAKLKKEFEKKFESKVKSSLHKEVIEKFNNALNQKFQSEKVRLGNEYKAQLRRHAQEELQRQKGFMVSKLEKEKENFELYREDEKRKMKDKLVNEFHKKLEAEVSKKENIIRNRLKNEFELNLKTKVQEHEAEIKKRKLDLELEMQRKIKQLLS